MNEVHFDFAWAMIFLLRYLLAVGLGVLPQILFVRWVCKQTDEAELWVRKAFKE